MLIFTHRHASPFFWGRGRYLSVAKERGVVLLISLIILVALSLGGIVLMRSVDTTVLISGNLAFQKAATRAGEAGIEDAIRNVLQASTIAALYNNDYSRGYSASSPATGSSANWWDNYWTTTLNPNPVALPSSPRSCVDRVCTLPVDAAGNTVSYAIQRMCLAAGDPGSITTGCSFRVPDGTSTGGGMGSGDPNYGVATKYYYRITARVVGPRNTISYIQSVVAN